MKPVSHLPLINEFPLLWISLSPFFLFSFAIVIRALWRVFRISRWIWCTQNIIRPDFIPIFPPKFLNVNFQFHLAWNLIDKNKILHMLSFRQFHSKLFSTIVSKTIATGTPCTWKIPLFRKPTTRNSKKPHRMRFRFFRAIRREKCVHITRVVPGDSFYPTSICGGVFFWCSPTLLGR